MFTWWFSCWDIWAAGLFLKDIVNNYFTHSPEVITASQPLKPEDIDNPNCVKVLSNDKSQAIKFFRNNEDLYNK